MTRKRKRKDQAVVIRTNGTASRACTGETLAFAMITGLALTSMAIGAWSILAFVSVLASEGPLALVAGFIRAITG